MDSSWIISAVTARLAGSLTLLLLFVYMYARFREPFLKWWMWAWVFYAAKFAFFIAGSAVHAPLFSAAERLSTVASAVALLHGTRMALGRPTGGLWPWAGACMAAWVMAAPLLGMPGAAVEYPLSFFSGWLHLLAGAAFLRSGGPAGFPGRLTGWALVVWGIHQMDYPLLRPLGIFAPWGFVLAAVLSAMAGLGQFLWLFELTRERMRVSEGRYREFFNVAPIGVLLMEEGSGVLEANAKAAELFGMSARSLLGVDPAVFIHPEDLERTPARQVRDNLGPGQSTRLTRRYRRQDGEYFHADVDVLRLGSEDRFLILIQDVTQMLTARQALAASEERFRTLVGNIPGAVYRCSDDEEWTASFLSDGIEELTGYPASDFVDNRVRSLASIIRPAERGDVRESMRRAVKRGRVYDLDYPIVHKDGSVRWVHERGRGVFAPSGELLWLDGVLQNDTRRKEAENGLRKALSFNQMIMRHVPVALSVYDGGTGQCVASNDALGDLLGDRMEHLHPRSFRDYPAWRSSGLTELAEETLAGLGVRRRDVRVKAPDGTEAVLECMFARFEVEGAPYLLRVAQDISARVRMEEVMIQTEKMMSVGGLAAGMAHEINNPLGGILQASQVVLGRLGSDSQASKDAAREAGCSLEGLHAFLEKRGIPALVGHIREAATRAARVVAGMLEFARADSSAHTLQDLREVLDQAVDICLSDYDLKKKYDFRHIRIERDYDETLPSVPCSRTQIEQVFLNILRNSAQAMSSAPGGEPVIRLVTRRENGHARVEIADNGPGMAPDVRRRIFEPFFTTKGTGDGTGLGLSVSYFIVVSNHDGSIEVQSEPGRGTAFIVRLPLRGGSDRADG